MKAFSVTLATILLTTLFVQGLDYSMIFYDYRVILGVIGGMYFAPSLKRFLERKL